MARVVNNRNKIEVRRDLRKNQTPEEILLWEKLRSSKTNHKWRRQVSIGNYIADFYCREKLLAIELDGAQHKENKEYDKERDKFFEFLGVKILRFWNSEVNKDISKVMAKIINELKTRKSDPFAFPGEGAGDEV